jgi:GNAT superfamily N-acetyltransferase
MRPFRQSNAPDSIVSDHAEANLSQHITVGLLTQADRARWGDLWEAYLAFYKTTLPPAKFDSTWARLQDAKSIFGLGARLDGQLVGITHYLFHASTWMDDVCYLQDLFTAPEARGHGVGAALIEAVAAIASARGCPRLYWQTQSDNATARRLYDRLAVNRGFIRYDYKMA